MNEDEAAKKIQSVFRGYRARKANVQSFENPAFQTDSFESASSIEDNRRVGKDVKHKSPNDDVTKENNTNHVPNGTSLKSVLKKPTLSAPHIKKTVSVALEGKSYSDDDLTKRGLEKTLPSITTRKSSIAEIALTLTVGKPSGAFNGPLFDAQRNKGKNMFIHPYGNPLNAVERALMHDFDFDNESFGKSLVRVKPTASPGSLMVWVVFFFCLVGVAGAIIFVSETARSGSPVRAWNTNATRTP